MNINLSILPKYIAVVIWIYLFLRYCMGFLYLSQIKEYRFDRLKVYFEEFGFWRNIILIPSSKPKKSGRNFIIFFMLIFFTIFISYLFNQISLLLLFSTALLIPFIALFSVFVGVTITHFFVELYRRIIVLKAKKHLSNIIKYRKDNKLNALKIVTITGSYGKSTTKNLAGMILAQDFEVATTIGNHNSQIGIALDVLSTIKNTTEVFVCEVGSYCIGEIHDATEYFETNVAILTSLGNQHLALFGSSQNLINAKLEILDNLVEGGDFITSNEVMDIVKNHPKFTKLISDKNIKIYIVKNQHISPFEYSLELVKEIREHIGVSSKQISSTLLLEINGQVRPIVEKYEENNFYNDTGSTSLPSLMRAIENLDNQKFKSYLISKGIIELGSEKGISYDKILESLEKTSNITFLTTDPLFFERSRSEKIKEFEGERELMNYLRDNLVKNTCVYLTGRWTDNFLVDLRKVFKKIRK